MGLSIAVFVPEGIVIASDGLAEIRNLSDDQSFLHKKQRRLFIFQNRFLVNIHGGGYAKGMPYAFYIEDVFSKLESTQFSTITDFATAFNFEMKSFLDDKQKLSFYVMGLEEDDKLHTPTPILLLWDNDHPSIINRSIDNKIVYNYHSVGHGLWLNKLLLPTSFEMGNGEKICFENVDIDFTKYSLEDAFDFSKDLFAISRTMDKIVQLKQMIGDYISYGIMTRDGRFTIVKDY